MVASRQVEIPFQRGNGRHRRWRIGVVAQGTGRNGSSFFPKHIAQDAKSVGADWLESATPEIAEVVSGRKNFKTAVKRVWEDKL